MSAPVITPPVPARKRLTRQQSIGLIFVCTLLGAVGQILVKTGANMLSRSNPWAMLTNIPLLAGYSLYGLMTVLFIYALRDEELSFVYPVISLTYVWVTGLSAYYFGDVINIWKILGIATIVGGVCVLGKGARQ